MTTSSDKTLFQSVIKVVDSLSATGNYDTIIHILSLLCLFSILNKNTELPAASAAVPAPIQGGGNPLQKILGELTKGDGASPLGGALSGALGGPLGGALGAALGSPDMLMSLLPLLNNPQIKSKLNPANIASVMGMLHNIGGGAAPAEKQDAPKAKTEKNENPEKKTPHPEPPAPAPAEPAIAEPPEPTQPSPVELKEVNITKEENEPEKTAEKEPEKKPGSRFLNWKTNF